jgi:hypothetical protein
LELRVLLRELGKRTVSSATRFIDKPALATDPNRRFQLTTDGMNAYAFPIGNILGDRVDYAQLIKIYNQNTPEEQRRYSPARLREPRKQTYMATQTLTWFAHHTLSVRTDRFASGASA